MKINFDEVDAKLFDFLTNKENQTKFFTTTQIAKILFKTKDVYELRKYDIIIRNRIRKWAKYGVFEISQINGISTIGVNLDKIGRKRFKGKTHLYVDLGKLKLLHEISNSNVRIRKKDINKNH